MCESSNDKKNSSNIYQLTDPELDKGLKDIFENKISVCHKCEKERENSKEIKQKKAKASKNPLLVEFSMSKLHLSPGKRKPLIRRSKLKILGSQIFQEIKVNYINTLSNVCNDINILMREQNSSANEGTYDSKITSPSANSESLFVKETCTDKLLLNRKGKPAFVENKNLFEGGKICSPFMHDFKSLSLKEKVIQSDTSSEACKQFRFSSHGLSHRGHILANQRILRKRSRKLSDSELPDLKALSISDNSSFGLKLSCAEQARNYEDITTDELAAYLDNFLYFPRKMSYMAEMMYT